MSRWQHAHYYVWDSPKSLSQGHGHPLRMGSKRWRPFAVSCKIPCSLMKSRQLQRSNVSHMATETIGSACISRLYQRHTLWYPFITWESLESITTKMMVTLKYRLGRPLFLTTACLLRAPSGRLKKYQQVRCRGDIPLHVTASSITNQYWDQYSEAPNTDQYPSFTPISPSRSAWRSD